MRLARIAIGNHKARSVALSTLVLGVVVLVPLAVATAANQGHTRSVLRFSYSADRSDAADLNGATVSHDVAVFARATSRAKTVEFFADDQAMAHTPYRVERVAPFDLGGTQADGSSKMISLSAHSGQHSLTVRVTNFSGSVKTSTATFNVAPASSPTPTTPASEPAAPTTTHPSTPTTVVPTPSTIAPTTTAPAPATTVAPVTTLPQSIPAGSAGCGLPNAIFCDTFDSPSATVGRSGDLNGTIWGVSRINTITNPSQGMINDWYPASLIGCGATQKTTALSDVRICNGRVVEAVSDVSGQSTLAMYPKQPFDFAGRTGTVAFDVSSDSHGPHAAWPEFWITDQPVPAIAAHKAGNHPIARNSYGFSLTLACDQDKVGVETMITSANYVDQDISFNRGECVTKGSPTGGLNRFQVRISQTHVEVWGTDAGATTFKLMASADLNLNFTKGLTWMVDAHYNACKEGFGDNQCDHTFAWDNFGFDGPATYRDLAFDVLDSNTPGRDAGSNSLGYEINSTPRALTIPGVYRQQAPTSALVTFNWSATSATVPSFRLNGGPWHETAWPFTAETYVWRTIAVTVPVSEIRDGDNVIEFKDQGDTVISNVDAILVAAAPVPAR